MPDPADKASPRHFETGRTAARTPDPWRSRTAVLIGRLLITLVLLPISPSVGALQPLEAPDTSSPRATFESFLALSDEAAHRLSDYRNAPGRTTSQRLFQVADLAAEMLDLRDVAPAARREVAAETFYLLWDVIARIPLPDPARIPDGAAAGNEGNGPLTHWRIPGTEITIAKVEDGPRRGEYLFSSDTVKRARQFDQLAQPLPYRHPMPSSNVYRTSQTFTGWLIPPRWVEALPAWANVSMLGQVLWKWAVLLLVFGLALALLLGLFLWSRRRSRDGSLRSYLRHVSTPAATLALAPLLSYLATYQINVSGSVAELPRYVAEIATGVAAVWVLWLTAIWIAEVIIASPRIESESLDAHLIRLAARSLGTLGILVLIFKLADNMGVPVYGLVAGAGVGGIAIALAAKGTLESFMGALNLFADHPVRIGDLCRYDEDQSGGWRAVGTVQSIGLRSTKIRKFDRSVITIPNADFAQRHILNLSTCDRFLLSTTLGLRYETTGDQLRFLLAQLRELLHAHAKTVHTAEDPVRVRFVGFGDFSLNVSLRAYIRSSSYDEFLAIQEDILLRVIDIVKESGSSFAFPSQTVYHSRDAGLDDERQQAAEKQVREWAAAHSLPFPDFTEAYRKRITDTLDYPPEGSPKADRG